VANHLPNNAKIPLKIRTNEKTIIVRAPTREKTECRLVKTVSYSVTLIRAKPANIHAKNKIANLSMVIFPSFTSSYVPIV
jgi:hypothetical protein